MALQPPCRRPVSQRTEPEELSEMDQDSGCTTKHSGMCSDRAECLDIGKGVNGRSLQHWADKYRNAAVLYVSKLDHDAGLGCPGGPEVKCCHPKGT